MNFKKIKNRLSEARTVRGRVDNVVSVSPGAAILVV
jgi:hypothetical protein